MHSTGKQVDYLSGRRPWSRGRFSCCSQRPLILPVETVSPSFPTNRVFLLQQSQSLGDELLTSNHSHQHLLPLSGGLNFPKSVRLVLHIHPGKNQLNVLGSENTFKKTNKERKNKMECDWIHCSPITFKVDRWGFFVLPDESRNNAASWGFLLLSRNLDLMSPSAEWTSWSRLDSWPLHLLLWFSSQSWNSYSEYVAHLLRYWWTDSGLAWTQSRWMWTTPEIPAV